MNHQRVESSVSQMNQGELGIWKSENPYMSDCLLWNDDDDDLFIAQEWFIAYLSTNYALISSPSTCQIRLGASSGHCWMLAQTQLHQSCWNTLQEKRERKKYTNPGFQCDRKSFSKIYQLWVIIRNISKAEWQHCIMRRQILESKKKISRGRQLTKCGKSSMQRTHHHLLASHHIVPNCSMDFHKNPWLD